VPGRKEYPRRMWLGVTHSARLCV